MGGHELVFEKYLRVIEWRYPRSRSPQECQQQPRELKRVCHYPPDSVQGPRNGVCSSSAHLQTSVCGLPCSNDAGEWHLPPGAEARTVADGQVSV